MYKLIHFYNLLFFFQCNMCNAQFHATLKRIRCTTTLSLVTSVVFQVTFRLKYVCSPKTWLEWRLALLRLYMQESDVCTHRHWSPQASGTTRLSSATWGSSSLRHTAYYFFFRRNPAWLHTHVCSKISQRLSQPDNVQFSILLILWKRFVDCTIHARYVKRAPTSGRKTTTFFI